MTIEPTDQDIAEAMKLVHAEDPTWIDMTFGDASTGAVAHARTLAKLRVAMEALEWISRNETEIHDEDLERNVLVAMSEDELSEIAHKALAQIRGGQ